MCLLLQILNTVYMEGIDYSNVYNLQVQVWTNYVNNSLHKHTQASCKKFTNLICLLKDILCNKRTDMLEL